jgi:hypothetical protein
MSLEPCTIYVLNMPLVLSQYRGIFQTMRFLIVTSLSFGRVQDLLSPGRPAVLSSSFRPSKSTKTFVCQLSFPSLVPFFRIFLVSLFFCIAADRRNLPCTTMPQSIPFEVTTVLSLWSFELRSLPPSFSICFYSTGFQDSKLWVF